MTVVVDASTVVAALLDTGPAGRWAEQILRSGRLLAPHSMPAEVCNVLRRAEQGGDVSPDVAALARHDLDALPVDLYPFEPFSARVWELRHSITPHDAWYVALAEVTGAPCATLDNRLTASHGPICRFETPPR